MTSLAFGTSAYSRDRGNLPELPLINMFVESTPTTAGQVVLQSRPGLVEQASLGSGPIRGVFQSDGVLNGDQITVSGSEVYRADTLLGSITGLGPVSFAADEDEIVIAAGGPLYRSTGLTIAEVTFPDDADVTKILSLGGYFLALRADTGQWYFSAVLDGSSWGALDYATAENKPDPLLDGEVANDVLILAGSESLEFWAKTGDADAPYAPIEGRVFQKGVIATGCMVKFDNTVAWIGNNRIIYTAGNVPDRISDAGIEERLAFGTTFSLWTFFFEGHEFLAARVESVITAEHQRGTWLFDAQTKQWCEFQSYGRTNWRAQCATQDGAKFGDDETGTIWEFGDGYVDAEGQLERRFRAGAPLNGGAFTADNVRLLVNVGETTDLTGDYTDPVVEMRTSRDGGRTWGNWRPAPLGAQGNYRTLCEWRRCGMFDAPGMLAEFRTSDPVPFRVSGVGVNEQGGGRSR